MNLPSVSRGGKLVSTDKVPLHVARTACGHRNPSPEIKPSDHDMASVYSDAGDTLASRPSNATSCEDVHHQEDPVRSSNPDSRDFILRRFLPAAQAMAETGPKSSTSTSSQHRLQKHSSARLPPSKRRSEDNLVGDENNIVKACGFPLHLGRLSLPHLRYSFWSTTTSRSTSCKPPLPLPRQKSPESGTNSRRSKRRLRRLVLVRRGRSRRPHHQSRSHDRRLRDAQAPRNRAPHPPGAPALHGDRAHARPPRLPRPAQTRPLRRHHGGQVDRLGARLSRMITKTNYMDPPRAGAEDQANSTSTSTATSSSTTASVEMKWGDAVASLAPPPSPKMPSESWLQSALPPEKFVEVRRASRKSLGSFIPIKPGNRQGAPVRLRQSYSLKEHLQGKHEA